PLAAGHRREGAAMGAAGELRLLGHVLRRIAVDEVDVAPPAVALGETREERVVRHAVQAVPADVGHGDRAGQAGDAAGEETEAVRDAELLPLLKEDLETDADTEEPG